MPVCARIVRVGAIVAMLAIGTGLALWGAAPPASPHDLLLLYVGADDCLPCRTWQEDAGARFRSSPKFARVVYREVKSPHLLDLLEDQYWPDELRRYRDRLDRGSGVPLWLVIADDEIVAQGSGMSQWRSTVLPKLSSLL
jgi:hypothetical protein